MSMIHTGVYTCTRLSATRTAKKSSCAICNGHFSLSLTLRGLSSCSFSFVNCVPVGMIHVIYFGTLLPFLNAVPAGASAPGLDLQLSIFYGVLQRKEENKQARTGLCLRKMITMWLKAMLRRLLFMILLLAVACVATPTSPGWPEGEVGTALLGWWELLESAAVVCKYPSMFSSVHTTSSA